MNSNSFALYANPSGSGAYANAERAFSNALAVGQTLSFQWGINFDSGNGAFASKGVVFSAGGSEISSLNLQNAGSSAITIGGSDVGFGYGTAVMTWSFTRTGTNLFKVVANDRDGNGVYSNNITVSNGAMDKIKFYAYNMQSGDQAQPYFNDLLIITTDADNVAPSIALIPEIEQVTWVAKNGTFSPSTSDVVASDNSGTVNVTFDPPTVSTTGDGLTKVTYTATDPSGNTTSVTRVIAVGSAAPGYRNLRFPVSLTVNTNSTNFAYGQIFVDGATAGAGAASGIQAWIGVNTANTDPATWDTSAWSTANYIGEEGNDDNFQGPISGIGRTPGIYYYATRFRLGTNESNTNYFYGGIGTDGVGGSWGSTRNVDVVTSGVTNTVTYTNQNGVLTVVAVRDVTFAVDMGVQIFKGLFNPATNGVEVRGDFNGFSGSPLVRQGTSSIYTNTFAVNGSNGAVQGYKFFGNGTNELSWEAGGNRSLTLGSSDTNLPTLFFNDLSESRKITFQVDMSVQARKASFNTNTGVVHLAGSFNGWNTTNLPLVALGNGIYSVEVTVDGPVGAIAYKFLKGTTTGDYEQVSDRTISAVLPNLEASTLGLDLFSKDDGIGPVITLNGPDSINLTVGDIYTDAGATATDLIDGSVTVTPSGTVDALVAGTYTITYNASDAAGNAAMPVTRTVIVAPAGISFDGWSSGGATNSEMVGKYAIGGATNSSAASEKPVATVDSNKLSLSAIVRTNDTNLTVVGEGGGSLTNWSTSGVSVTASTNTNGVPDGCQRKVFSVDRTNSPTKQFLRLKATLAP